jgi:hypothetical protein
VNVRKRQDPPPATNFSRDKLELLKTKLSEHPLWTLKFYDQELLFESLPGGHGLLWHPVGFEASSMDQARTHCERAVRVEGGKPWRLPTSDELRRFAKIPTNPVRVGKANRLSENGYAYSESNLCDLDHDAGLKSHPLAMAGFFNLNSAPVYKITDIDMLAPAVINTFALSVQHIYPAKRSVADDIWQPLLAAPSKHAMFSELDWAATRLPRLDPSEYEDPNKGLWELWGTPNEQLEAMGVVARNPVNDINFRNIAIDFGTSSTVVAYKDNGVKKLLRVGLHDYLEQPVAAHFENPTVLQFIDFDNLFAAWNKDVYRPAVQWTDVCSSHEALAQLRNNETDPAVVASIMPKIKQWALRQAGDHRTRITDNPLHSGRKPMEYELSPLTLNAPVKGERLTVNADDALDPVELYAWFLGMIINWRKFGLHLHYSMTFPVEYPRDVREKILASFKRGLQRSLPAPLIDMPEFNEFKVLERASEPAAYAACALKTLGIEATADGVAYAVFDFGGGTTDFDFGYYRLPDAEEDDQGVEQVFEHFSAAGDRFLGGENLLENMAYRVFQDNLDQCRERKIVFTRPLDAGDFPGWEPFIDQSQAAHTNTLMLMSQLRPLWEGREFDNSTGMLNLQLLNREGAKVACSLRLDDRALHDYLQERIGKGIYNFCVAMHKAFAGDLPERIHVLLAGNASRARWVLAHFGLLKHSEAGELASINHLLLEQTEQWLEQLFGSRVPSLLPHAPLDADQDAPYAPTAKTGVALGLLDLYKGSPIKVINRGQPDPGGEAPFGHYVGRIRKGLFMPGLLQGAPYRQWFELGPQRERIFELRHTDAPEAYTGAMADGAPALRGKHLDLSGVLDTDKVYARALTPNSIDICAAASLEAAHAGQFTNLQTIVLKAQS